MACCESTADISLAPVASALPLPASPGACCKNLLIGKLVDPNCVHVLHNVCIGRGDADHGMHHTVWDDDPTQVPENVRARHHLNAHTAAIMHALQQKRPTRVERVTLATTLIQIPAADQAASRSAEQRSNEPAVAFTRALLRSDVRIMPTLTSTVSS